MGSEYSSFNIAPDRLLPCVVRTPSYPRKSVALVPGNSDSACARFIKTRRGTLIDESLLPAAHQECLNKLREAAREAAGKTHISLAGALICPRRWISRLKRSELRLIEKARWDVASRS